ncbi:hypothetical protein HAX54_006678 [Datura stramonium]|uniref:Uncharacterized protein n=1 Tax=Datura stramonium TaxID=4076 RepID=A0ABS8TAM8_DATST|nr:hypothetical protein [Datura stramonium]
MDDKSIRKSMGIVEDMLVKVGKFVLPANFVVLDYDVDIKIFIILRHPFLAIERALMNSESMEGSGRGSPILGMTYPWAESGNGTKRAVQRVARLRLPKTPDLGMRTLIQGRVPSPINQGSHHTQDDLVSNFIRRGICNHPISNLIIPGVPTRKALRGGHLSEGKVGGGYHQDERGGLPVPHHLSVPVPIGGRPDIEGPPEITQSTVMPPPPGTSC